MERGEKTDSSPSDENLIVVMISDKKKRRIRLHPLLQSGDGEAEFDLLTEELKLYHSQFQMHFKMLQGQFVRQRTVGAWRHR